VESDHFTGSFFLCGTGGGTTAPLFLTVDYGTRKTLWLNGGEAAVIVT
jgi:hypothetical protein